MILSRYRVPAAAILAGAILIALSLVLLAERAAHADPAGAVVTAPTVVSGVNNTITMIFAIGAGMGILLAGFGVILHAWQARSPGNVTVAALAKDVDLAHDKLDELLALGRGVAGLPPAPSAVTTPKSTGPLAPLLVMLLLGAVALQPACGASAATRTSTLSAALVTVDASAKAFETYDGTHQAAIVAAAKSADDGKAALAAYRAKRAAVEKAFVVAYEAIAVASTLNDDPSLTGAQAALAQVIAAVKALTGGAQ